MIFITGDTHGNFERVEKFCRRFDTSAEDILIILGDAGINFSGAYYDSLKKKLLESLPITIFAIHGNHEQRPNTIKSYREKMWHGGFVYYEEDYPSILFAKDGEIFDFNGKRTIVIGGAYSVDKEERLENGWGWWEDEQPSDEIKRYVEQQLEKSGWKVDAVLSHAAPLKYEPVEVFMPGVDQSMVDRSTEIWLDQIEDRLTYARWYCGHYHIEKRIDKFSIMFESFDEFFPCPFQSESLDVRVCDISFNAISGYDVILIQWDGSIGFGEYEFYKDLDQQNWFVMSECMDSNQDKSFGMHLLEDWLSTAELVDKGTDQITFRSTSKKIDITEVKLCDVATFKSEECEGILIKWSSPTRSGEYKIYKIPDSENWCVTSGGIDSADDRSFGMCLLKKFMDIVQIEG